MTEIEFLRNLYIEDLEKGVDYYGDNRVRPRVRHIETWKRVETKLNEGIEHEIVLPLEDTTRQIWVWSDLHLGHKNIINYSDRPYPDVSTMNECLIKNFCDCVGPNDISIWVGDITFQNDSTTNEMLARCPGYKILIVGNHDFNKKKVRKLNFDEVHLIKHINIDGVNIVASHYPMENLPLPYINVHGHLHAGGADHVNTLQHINVNCEFHNYKPVNLNEIIKWAKSRLKRIEELPNNE